MSKKRERNLLHSAKGLEIAERFFPKSLSEWRNENPEPAKIFAEKPSLKCEVCAKELLDQKDKGVIIIWERFDREKKLDHKQVEYIFWTCRGHCDDLLCNKMRAAHTNLVDGWEDISDVMIPTIFIKWVMSTLNEQHAGKRYSDQAFKNLKTFLLRIFPYISRQLSKSDKEQIETLMEIPSYLGGLGYEK